MTGRRSSRSPEAQAYRWLYNTAQWKALRLSHLRAHPLCATCLKAGKTTAASVADHKIEHKGDQTLFFDPDNLQSLCLPHHDAGKQREERAGYHAECDETGWPTDQRHPANGGSLARGPTAKG